MTTFYIDPSQPTNGAGTQNSPFNVWPTLFSGNTYLQKAGTLAPFLNVIAPNVTLSSYGAGAFPILAGIAYSSAVSGGSLTGFDIKGASVGVTFNGANGVTVSGNIIENNTYFGVSDQGGWSNTISANTIQNNGGGGIELSNAATAGDLVRFNIVTNNGSAGPGYSGIHTYGGAVGTPTGLGNANVIEYNVIAGTLSSSYDGNGIQTDDYTSNNVVVGNVVGWNKGSGLFILGGSGNQCIYNVTAHNGLDNYSTELNMSTNGPSMSGNIMNENLVFPGFGVSYLMNSGEGVIENTFTGSTAVSLLPNFISAFKSSGAPPATVAAMLAIINPLSGQGGPGVPSLNLKSFNQLVSDQVAAIQSQSNVLIDFSIGSILRAFTDSCSGIGLWLQSLALTVLSVTRAATSSGSDLDSFINDYGMTRLPGAPSNGVVTFSRFSPVIQVVIPVGTPVQTSDGSQQFVVVANTSYSSYSATLGGYVVPGTTASLAVPVQSLNQMAAANVVAGSITVLTQSIVGVDYISNALPTAGGQNPELDSAVRIRFVAYLASLARGTKAAVTYAIMAVQSGLFFSIVENTNYVTGLPQPGFFYAVVDDGSGNPPSTLLSSVYSAIDLYRAEGVQFAVYPPILVYAAIAMTITTGTTFDHATIATTVQNAVSTYVNTLLDGAELTWSSLFQVAYNASPGVVNVSNVTINGSVSDLVVNPNSVIRTSTVAIT